MGGEDGRAAAGPAGPAGGAVLTAHDLELSVASWQQLVPADHHVRAALLHAVVQRAGLSSAMFPAVAAALGVGDEQVAAAFRHLYGTDAAAAMAHAPGFTPPRPAWLDDHMRLFGRSEIARTDNNVRLVPLRVREER